VTIPQLDSVGLLPAGVWPCSLADVNQQFCWNDHRQQLWETFAKFLDEVYHPALAPAALWIDGSFATGKEDPSDIDVVVDCHGHPSNLCTAALELWWYRQSELKRLYKVDFYLRHPSIPNDLGAWFQYVGEKTAHRLNLDVKHPKGILSIVP